MRYPFLRVALILVVSLASVVPVYAADNKAIAKDAYLEGQRLYELGEFQKALDSFKRAYLNYDDPAFLFNLGQCYRMLGDKPEAVRSYKQYLRKVPNGGNSAEIEKIVHDLETAIEQDRTSRTRPPEGVRPPNGEPGTSAPATGETSAPAATGVAASASPRAEKPVYKKWWLWTIVGGVVVAGVAVGLGVGLSGNKAPNNNTTLPDIGPGAHASLRGGLGYQGSF
jgi:tetratricopeptide (TPR) repeat protein